jgi:hypothetical protein
LVLTAGEGAGNTDGLMAAFQQRLDDEGAHPSCCSKYSDSH